MARITKPPKKVETAQQVIDFPNFNFMAATRKDTPWLKMLPKDIEEVNEDNLNTFFEIMIERQEIWYKKVVLKQPWPWTENKILRDYKYTNVYRELDRASQWMIENVLKDHSLSVKDLVWRIIIFRFFNLPATFEVGGVELPHYDDFDPEYMWQQVVSLREKGVNPYHTAYLQNLAFLPKPANWNGRGLFKDEAIINYAFPRIHKKIPELVVALKTAESPEVLMKIMEQFDAVGGFMSHEFFIDFCYVARYWKKPIMKFDQNDYTNVGPGASLGLRLIFPSLMPKEQKRGIYVLRDIAHDWMEKLGEFKYLGWDGENYVCPAPNERLTLHQIEMWLCEYSKYWKMQHNVGKQRSRYKVKKRS